MIIRPRDNSASRNRPSGRQALEGGKIGKKLLLRLVDPAFRGAFDSCHRCVVRHMSEVDPTDDNAATLFSGAEIDLVEDLHQLGAPIGVQ